MTNHVEHPGKIVQTKKGVYKLNNVRFYDYTQTNPEPGRCNVIYIRDLPSVQLQFLQRPQAEIDAIWLEHKRKIHQAQAFITMTHTLARHIIQLYDLDPNFPYGIFMNYPSWQDTPQDKRNEFVYIGAIPVKFTNTLKFLARLQRWTGYESFFVKRKYYKNNSLTNDCLHVDNYDFGSKFGLLINENEFPQAAESLSRKLLLYLCRGIYPVIHKSFTESIKYCYDNNVIPIVYSDVDDLINTINGLGERGLSRINGYKFSMEHREAELIMVLDHMSHRGIAPLSAKDCPSLTRRSNRRRAVNRETR